MNKICKICGSTNIIESHHVYGGTANRKVSEANGFKVYLCYEHHRGTYGVHGKYGSELKLKLQQETQEEYEKNHSRAEFMNIIGRNYLD